MGQKRQVTIDLTEEASEAKSSEAAAKEEKKRKPKKSDKPKAPPKKSVQKKQRSRRYRLTRSEIDRTKTYSPQKAFTLLKKLSNTKFDATVEVHLNLTESKLKTSVTFPHSTGKKTTIAIATDALLKKIESGQLDFDILLATPDMMPKLAKHAKTLGPKGLMPNPKSGTITQDPEKKKKELEGGKTLLKSEPKAPLMHTILGKVSQPEANLIANLTALVKAISLEKITKITISSSMSPGIRLNLSSFKKA